MRWFIRTYLTIGATLGVILAVPAWQKALEGQVFSRSWSQAEPPGLKLLLATGHGVLRMYSWLPSLIYYMGEDKMTFRDWLFTGW